MVGRIDVDIVDAVDVGAADDQRAPDVGLLANRLLQRRPRSFSYAGPVNWSTWRSPLSRLM